MKTMNQKTFDLQGVLREHKLWLDSQGDSGCWANLSGVNLSGADLHKANLSGANLSGANLRRSNLSEADLSAVNFCDANLNEADLSGAKLSGANLSGATIFGGKFCGVTIDGARVNPYDFGGPGHILCALTADEWSVIETSRKDHKGIVDVC